MEQITPPSGGAGDRTAPGEPSDDTRARLVAAAADVFAERGYDKAGVAEIARRAGLTTGAIYSRFSGKAELLAETIRTYCSDEFDRLFAQHQFQGRATDLLVTVGAHLVDREPMPGRSILLEAFVAARRDPDVALVLRRHLVERAERLQAMVEESKEAGVITAEVDTAATVHFAHAVGLGFLLFDAVGADHPGSADWQDVVDRVVRAFIPPGAPAPEVALDLVGVEQQDRRPPATCEASASDLADQNENHASPQQGVLP
ncbi:MAG: TetR/AcrR family transcriptional regulator [Acidimicrobiia bacterium]|nr:TetR/AcrR family transcriptional regulator [Acidimicrobiia bacterium]